MVDAVRTLRGGKPSSEYGATKFLRQAQHHNSYMRFKNLLLLIFISSLVFLSGCATLPPREALPTYSLNGTTYIALIPLCRARGITCNYDTYTRQVSLKKDAHEINLLVGDTMVLVDGLPQHLKHPVDIYQGTVVVPYKFKEQVLDKLFEGAYPGRKTAPIAAKLRKVVIDAGHGGNDPGAMGKSGLREKDVNLDIARRLARILKSEGVEVVLTRSGDRFIPLHKRVDIANNSRADIFISIHSNANRVRTLNGFEVYYVASSVSDTKRAYTAAQEAALNLDSSCFAGNSQDLKAILWDMIYTYSRAESIELSRFICKAMDNNLGGRSMRIKGARFEVLRGVRMPGVLIETGFLSNREEEQMLKNGYYRQKIAESIADGIGDYSRGFLAMGPGR